MVIISLELLLCATYWPLSFGWLSLLSIIALCAARPSWKELAWWCSALLGGHFWWIALCAYQHMAASLYGACMLYALTLGWGVAVTWLFWWLVSHLRCWPLTMLPVYFYLLACVSTPFLSGIRGYPFAQPALPCIAWWHNNPPTHGWQTAAGCQWYPLPPLMHTSPVGRAQELMMAIASVPPCSHAGPRFIVAPESTITAPLCSNDDCITWWREVLPTDTALLVGGVLTEKKRQKCAQAAFLATKNPITQWHIKHNCVDFFETTQENSAFARFLQKIVGWQTHDFVPAPAHNTPIMHNGRTFHVLLCADGLWAPYVPADVCVVLVNQTWFAPWVQELFFAALAYRAWWYGQPTIVVGHGKTVCFAGKLPVRRFLSRAD